MKAARKCYCIHLGDNDYMTLQADTVRDGPAFPFLFNGRRYISGLDENSCRVSIDQEHIVAVEETTCECALPDDDDGDREEKKVRDLGPSTAESKSLIEWMREHLAAEYGIPDIFRGD